MMLRMHLHGDLNEEIQMNVPLEVEGSAYNKVCKLRNHYGLKQSFKAWFGRFSILVKNSKHKQNLGDHAICIMHSAAVGVITLLV